MTKFTVPIPILRSFDEKAAKAFYLDFLGFELGFEHRFEEDAPLYFEVRRGDCVLHISEHFGDATPGSGVRIDVPDAHAYCAEINAKQYSHAKPQVMEQTWGYDEIILTDPAGNRIVFGTAHKEKITMG